MRFRSAFWLLLIALLCKHPAIAGEAAANRAPAASQPAPVMKAVRIDKDFDLDGNLSKPLWQNAAPVVVDGMLKEATTRPELATNVRCLWSDQYLYLGYECPFTKLTTFEPPYPPGRKRMGLWDRDVVEAFIGTDDQHINRYAEFEVAPTNERLDLWVKLPDRDFEWTSRFESAVKIDAKAHLWTAEWRIPLSALSPSKPQPGTRWRLNLYRADAAAGVFLAWNPTLTATAHTPERFGTLEFQASGAPGAGGDARPMDTASIQAAIDAASQAGGGTVVIPPGRHPIARIQLKSNVTLRLQKGAVLLASTQRDDYAGGPNAVLYASDAEHIAVEGEGAINGQATADYGARWGAPTVPAFRTGLVRFEKCRDVSFRGMSLLYSDSWTLHLRRCERVRIDGITIHDNYKRLNSDGIDPNSCKDVKISNCRITCGDDAIVLKSTEAVPCEDIEVSDCLLESATAGLKLGTESKGDFRNIVFRNCKIVNSPVGVGFYLKDGATMENIVCEKIDMDLCPPTYHAVVPLFIDIEKRNADSKIGTVRNVTFRDINITGGAGLLLQGMPESPLQNITLRNITFTVKQAENYAKRSKPVGGRRTTRDDRDTKYARAATWAALANIKGLVVDGFQVNIAEEAFKQFPRTALSLFNVDSGQLLNISRQPRAATPPAIELTNCKDVGTAAN